MCFTTDVTSTDRRVRGPERLVRGRRAAPAHARRHPAHPRRADPDDRPGPVDRRRPGRRPAGCRAAHAVRRGRLHRRPATGPVRLQPGCRGGHRCRPRRHPRPGRPHRPARPRAGREGAGASTSPPAPSRCSTASRARPRALLASAGPHPRGPRRRRHRRCPARSSTRPGGPCSRRSCRAGTTTTCPAHIGRALGAPVLVDNDVNLMALGEHATVYPDVQHLIFVKVATGIGAGIISGGRLHRGRPGRGGRPRPRRRAARRRHPVHLRQRRLPRGRRQRPGHREGVARERDRRRSTAAA